MIRCLKNIRPNSVYYFLLATFLSVPGIVSAQINIKLKSPLGEVNSVEEVLVALLNAFIIIATPIVVLYIIYAGFLYVTARGNAEQTKQATTALTYAVIGGVILIGAVAISEILANIVGAFTNE
jgi:heme/copper-type cytochrome/quinol oxidase subunit 2